MTYLRHPASRYRWGVSIIEAFDADGHVIRYPWERPSVRPEPVVLTEPVTEDDGLLAVLGIAVLLAVGVCLGMWL